MAKDKKTSLIEELVHFVKTHGLNGVHLLIPIGNRIKTDKHYVAYILLNNDGPKAFISFNRPDGNTGSHVPLDTLRCNELEKLFRALEALYSTQKLTYSDFVKKYPSVDREELTEDEERTFVEDCYRMYETEGFAKGFRTIYLDTKNLDGKPFTVLRRYHEHDGFDLETLPQWQIEIEGKKIQAFPEEITRFEQSRNR